MSRASIDLALDDDVAEVGSRFRGRVARLAPIDDLAQPSDERVRAIRVQLRYETDGVGDTDSAVVSAVEVLVEEHGNADAAFELAIPPEGAISYDGRLIRVLWQVTATVDIALRRDQELARPVLVVPDNGWGLYRRAHPLPRHR